MRSVLDVYNLKNNKVKILIIGLLCSLFVVFSSGIVQAAGTQTITGNTSSGENDPGWYFNRDITTTTPYEFNTDTAKIGSGSLFVPSISGAPASNKFIGENFLVTPVSNVNSISFDFKLASGSNVADGQHFYMNVYANFAASDDLKFYDCRYNVIGTVGSTSSWTTMTFNPATAHNVTTRTGGSASPYTCPTVPNDMDTIGGVGSNIRAIAISVGDTSSSDAGVSGYLDNVVYNLDSNGITVYDFEPVPPPTVNPCTAVSTLHTTDLSAWDLSQSRSQGSNELVDNGLDVETWNDDDNGSPDQRKAAGYYTTNFALEDAGVPNIEFASYSGVRPSLQLGIDKDGNGSRDAYLVYEPWAYGDGKYWATAYLGVPAGMGYSSFGTLNDYLAANPNARIVQIGYSLGSGVVGQAIISKLTAGCVDYTFGLPPVVTPTDPVGGQGGGTDTSSSNNPTSIVTVASTSSFFAAIGGGQGGGSTETPAATTGETKPAEVKADEAGTSSASTDDNKKGFNWWWLLVIALIIALIYAGYRRYQASKEE